jgi:trigger factor
LAGRLVDFKVKVNEVYNMELPELNDEFAKGLGNFATIKDVEEQIRKNILTEAESKESLRQEEEILDKIIEQSKFDDIADVLVDSEAKKMLEELEHNLSHQGLKIEDYLMHLKKTREELLLDFVPQAIKRVKSALVIRKVAETENIKASGDEIDMEVQKTLAEYGDETKVAETLKQPAYRDYLKNILTARKVIDYLKSVMVK